MKSKDVSLILILTLTLGLIACSDSGTKQSSAQPGVEDAVKTAIDAYIYGYPLVTMDMTRRQVTNVGHTRRYTRAHGPTGEVPYVSPSDHAHRHRA